MDLPEENKAEENECPPESSAGVVKQRIKFSAIADLEEEVSLTVYAAFISQLVQSKRFVEWLDNNYAFTIEINHDEKCIDYKVIENPVHTPTKPSSIILAR